MPTCQTHFTPLVEPPYAPKEAYFCPLCNLESRLEVLDDTLEEVRSLWLKDLEDIAAKIEQQRVWSQGLARRIEQLERISPQTEPRE